MFLAPLLKTFFINILKILHLQTVIKFVVLSLIITSNHLVYATSYE